MMRHYRIIKTLGNNPCLLSVYTSPHTENSIAYEVLIAENVHKKTQYKFLVLWNRWKFLVNIISNLFLHSILLYYCQFLEFCQVLNLNVSFKFKYLGNWSPCISTSKIEKVFTQVLTDVHSSVLFLVIISFWILKNGNRPYYTQHTCCLH
jgi:hypothetical protein